MLHVFVFLSVTDVIITRHRQNIYLPVYARRWRRAVVVVAMVGVEGRGGVAGGADSVTGVEIGVIGGVSLAGVVVEEVGMAHLAEVVTLVATDGTVVSALLELDFMSCCPRFLSNITRLFFCTQTVIVGEVPLDTLAVSVVVVARNQPPGSGTT